MTYTPLTESVEMYRTTDMSLSQIAARAGVEKEELASELRSQGITLREEDQDDVGQTTRN